jgi:hypothetical protein
MTLFLAKCLSSELLRGVHVAFDRPALQILFLLSLSLLEVAKEKEQDLRADEKEDLFLS